MQEKISPKYTNKLFWKNKNILITGINGFIGGNLTKKLVSLGRTSFASLTIEKKIIF